MNDSLKYSILFHALVIFAFASGQPLAYIPLALMFLYSFAINFKVFSTLSKVEFNVMWIYFFVVFSMGIVNFLNSPIVSFHLALSVICILMALIFTRHPTIYYRASKISLYLFQFIALGYVAFKGLKNFPLDVPFEHMIEGASANGITSYMILLQINLTIVRFLLFRKVTIYTSILTLIVALLGYGRGSIISAFLIIIINLYTFFALKSKVKFITAAFVSIFVVCSVVAYYMDEIFIFLEANTKLSAGIVDVSRSKIIREYWGEINGLTIFTGADYTETSIPLEFNGNPHNSFIRAHHIFGLPYLLFILIFPFYAIFKKKGVLEIFYYFSMLMILFFRVFSEPIIFPTIFDFYFLSMFLLIAKVSKPFQYLSN